MAGGSLLELETQLIISKELKLIGSKLYQKVQRLIIEENKMLNAFIKSISNKK
jgi:four helix bundle protein